MSLVKWDFASFDGVKLKIHEAGEGRLLVLLHGLFSNAQTNWIKYGHAQILAEGGYRVIMPDLRAHGESEAPHDPAAYPENVLVKDVLALIEYLDEADFDLGGFSLGARTCAKVLAAGVEPRRAILAGMGLQGLSGWAKRRDFFFEAIDGRDTVKRGDPHWLVVQFMKSQNIDPVAARLLLRTFSDMSDTHIASIAVETGVICGREDRDNGSPQELAALLPDSRLIDIPGTHMGSVTNKDLGQAMADFLTG